MLRGIKQGENIMIEYDEDYSYGYDIDYFPEIVVYASNFEEGEIISNYIKVLYDYEELRNKNEDDIEEDKELEKQEEIPIILIKKKKKLVKTD